MLPRKVAIVTGASRGIGRAIAERLAADGIRVVVHYGQSAREAEAVADGIDGVAMQADMADLAAVRRLFTQVDAAFGRLDVFVNNAGIANFKPLLETTEDDYDQTFSVNTKGAFFALQEAARRMAAGGRIINVSTGATLSGTANGAIYCGSKAALEQFTRALARELGPREITVNTLSPGFTDTDMLRQFPALVERAAAMSPFGRVGTPRDIADVVAFLVSEQARWLTGQNIQAGGGVNM